MSNKTNASEIIAKIGGTDNIKDLVHCATRLRFTLKNYELANKEELERIDGVQGVVFRTNQLQIIIGQGTVEDYYKEIISVVPQSSNQEKNREKTTKFNFKSLFDAFLETVSSIFAPIIPAIVGSGMIMGVLYSLQVLGWIDPTSSIFQILNVFSNAAFYFLPMYLAFSSAKQFGSNQFVAAVLGAILIHPTFISMIGEGNTSINLGLIQITLQNYTSSVVPIILSVYFMSHVEKLLKRFVPKMIDIIVTPTLSLLISGVVALWLLGPLGQFVGQFVANGFLKIYQQFGLLGGLLYGLTYPFILSTGMQVAFSPITVMNLQSLGHDFLYPFSAASNAAMAAAALYVFWKSRDAELKSLAGSTGISGLIGVTEPVLYGLVLKFKNILYAVMIGGGVGGAIMGLFQVTYGGFGFVPFGTIILAFGPTFPYYLLGVFSAMTVTVLVLHYIGFDNNKKLVVTLSAPVEGKVISLSEVKDPTFAKGYIGQGFAVVPEKEQIFAPCDGVVETLFPTNHAIGIKTESKVEVLIHVGIDTVKLKGEGFISNIKQGDTVKKGDLLITFDKQLIEEEGYDSTVSVVVTNSSDFDITVNTAAKNRAVMNVMQKGRK